MTTIYCTYEPLSTAAITNQWPFSFTIKNYPNSGNGYSIFEYMSNTEIDIWITAEKLNQQFSISQFNFQSFYIPDLTINPTTLPTKVPSKSPISMRTEMPSNIPTNMPIGSPTISDPSMQRYIELQLQFAESLKLQIITSIFKQKVKLPSTRAHSLVSCSILKECHKFQLYVRTNIAGNMVVNRYLQKNPSISAVTLMGVVIDELQVAANRSLSIFQRDVYQLYDEFNFTPVYIKPLTDYSGNIHNLNRNSESKDNSNAFGKDKFIRGAILLNQKQY